GLTKFLSRRPNLVVTDYNPDYLRVLGERYQFWNGVETCQLDLMAPTWDNLPKRDYDTVVSANVLEHIKDDRLVLKNAFRLLKPGGKVIMFVPAHQWLYGK